MEENIRRPKVSVCVVTYNQVKYIRQCLQSVVDQVTDFDFELVVGDDCSTDGTRDVVADFCEMYPRIARPLFQTRNVGPYENYLRVHEQAVGEYVAHIDGDDFAMPGKLQAQADMMDPYPNCNVVWHPVDTLHADGTMRHCHAAVPGKAPIRYTRRDQINFGVIGAHSSTMYRARVCELEIPKEGFIDFFLTLVHLGSGFGAMLQDRSYGVVRVGIGISSSGYATRRILLENLNLLLRTEPESRDVVNSLVLHLMLSDLKRRSPTLRTSFLLFLRSFSLAGISTYLRTFSLRRAIAL